MTFHVPDDFPHAAAIGSLPGVQRKFSVSTDVDGRLREPGDFVAWRERDYRLCREILDWGVDFVLEKAAKPKYACLSHDEILAKFELNLASDFGLPTSLRRWILTALAKRLGWQSPLDPSDVSALERRSP